MDLLDFTWVYWFGRPILQPSLVQVMENASRKCDKDAVGAPTCSSGSERSELPLDPAESHSSSPRKMHQPRTAPRYGHPTWPTLHCGSQNGIEFILISLLWKVLLKCFLYLYSLSFFHFLTLEVNHWAEGLQLLPLVWNRYR